MPATPELKPCPFCGSKARLHKQSWKDVRGIVTRYWVRCAPCGSCSEEYNTAEKAEAAWNRRDYHDGLDHN